MGNHQHSCTCTCFIIPSSVLRKLAAATTVESERQFLLDQVEQSARIRGQRSATTLAGTGLGTGERRRTVYDAQHKTRLPGKLVRGETDPARPDEAINQAFDGAGATYDFYLKVLKRNSVDGKGSRLDSTVHYRKDFNNAFWDGRQMVYGDGDGKLFTGFTGAVDVIAHELTHGVTQHTVPGGGLTYEDQSGALNESFSDVFGSVVKQWKLKQTSREADWLIGAGIMMPQVGKALRSMSDPGNTALTWSGDDQPGAMSGYVEGGDVHTNSGIPNHAFYIAALGLNAHSWEKAGRIWYKSLALLTPDATFAEAAEATLQAAATLYGAQAREVGAVKAAWKEVGVI